MSKIFAILLSCLVFIQSIGMSFDDILQFDELIEHAQFHKKQYGDDFFTFFSKHYGNLKADHSKKHKEEQKDHEDLPFQYQGQICSFTTLIVLYSEIESHFTGFSKDPEANFYYQSSLSSLHKKALLQPPKQV